VGAGNGWAAPCRAMPSDRELDGIDGHLLSRFHVVRQLGRGAYGIVWKVVEKETGRTLALKRCFDAFQNATDAQRTFREIMLLQELNGHENIVRLMNVVRAENHKDLYALFGYMESDLQKVINAGMLQALHIEYVTYQILKALKFVHSGNVLHRDLKPANVLLNANCHVRLCDFGLARTREGQNGGPGPLPGLLTEYVATRWYRAPELLMGANSYCEGVDMWSVGCILGEMVGGKPILKGKSTMDQLQKVVELTGKPSDEDLLPISRHSSFAKQMLDSLGNVKKLSSTGILFLVRAPPAARKLILALLKFNPETRLRAEVALEDPFVEKFYRQEAECTCDKVIRMPIADTTKMKASDYRNHIYGLIAQRKKMAMEDHASEESTRTGSKVTKQRSTASLRGVSARKLTIRNSRSSLGSGRETARSPTPLPWSHEGGAVAPPTTPR